MITPEHNINLCFRLIDEKLFMQALLDLASQDFANLEGPADINSNPYPDNTLGENIGLVVCNLDVLALSRHTVIGWEQVGLERING
jgi:hypothetical protein